jgi:hypothetical protein
LRWACRHCSYGRSRRCQHTYLDIPQHRRPDLKFFRQSVRRGASCRSLRLSGILLTQFILPALQHARSSSSDGSTSTQLSSNCSSAERHPLSSAALLSRAYIAMGSARTARYEFFVTRWAALWEYTSGAVKAARSGADTTASAEEVCCMSAFRRRSARWRAAAVDGASAALSVSRHTWCHASCCRPHLSG